MNREDLIRAIAGEIDLNMPFVMVASERIANLVLEEAAKVARNACLVPPDGGAPTEEERLMCEQAADEIRALRARVAELEGALTEISKQTYGTEIWMDGDERAEILGRHLVRLRSLAFTALKGASHEQ